MSQLSPVQTRVQVRNTPSGVLRPFIDSLDIKVSSHGAPWDDALSAEHVLVAPCEMEDCYIGRTTIVQPLVDQHIAVQRLGARSLYETGSVEGVIHIDPLGSLTGARWRDPLNVLFLMPSESTFQRVLGELRSVPSRFELMRSSYVQDAQIRQIGLAILAECRSGFSSGRLYGESLAIALAARLVTCYSSHPLNLPGEKTGLPAWRLRRVIDFIEENIGAELGLTDIATVAGFSDYHFSRMFKLSTGLTPHRYVMERRVARAKELLAHSPMSIGELSTCLGFGDQAHLTTVFKRLTGTTPKNFREQAV
ncbi:helix-turn-helix domain-containing protein [Noviherbaspirillum sedimenti]|uniref:AraC family transcriptional regulator n=1 Tax=Noviherbaspirillum sedimenti TaxID=2320865 RepID=A0A3A3GNU7_9BURK|nr:AraC family transcriptional regulator [Noviherbaspirillum sedimenti]RJG03996.1 AraC family transcriptional regulator [Noviherbaspirillum sedimenti]